MSLGYVARPPPKVPKDGFGPRGAPDCYYTSRVLNSTARYVQFVKKLRQEEEEARLKYLKERKERGEKRADEFIGTTTRRALINKISCRVDLCLKAYQDTLQEKRQKLLDLLTREEEKDIRLLVQNVQSGFELSWKDKMDHLDYLIAKRKKEHEDKFKDTPLTKSAHVLPCIIKLQAKEAEEIQLYQMREKQLRKLAEKEYDKMWHEVLMKETEALATRIEYETIQLLNRDKLAKQFSIEQLEQRRVLRAKEQERLKQETIRMKAQFDADTRKEEEAECKRQEILRQQVEDMKRMMQDRKEVVAKREADGQIISSAWDSLAGQGLADEKAKEQRRRQKERELDECNRKMIDMKNHIADMKYDNDPLIFEEGQRRRDVDDLRRCQHRLRTAKLNRENSADVQKQVREKEEALKNQYDATDDYNSQVSKQLDELVKYNELTAAQARKMNLKDIQQQMEYNKLLKDRARQEAINEEKKCQIAKEEYQEEIKKMLSRPFFSDRVHPFMKKMSSGLKMCHCGPSPNYCSYPQSNPSETE